MLRELSVLIGVKTSLSKKTDCYVLNDFLYLCKGILPEHQQSLVEKTLIINNFDKDHIAILKNGYNLSRHLLIKFNITTIKILEWYGLDTQKESPEDILVNEYPISLKEESFILENMGLYKFVNLLTGSKHNRLHIFQDYAPKDYENWFSKTWELLIDFLDKNNGEWEKIDAVKFKKSKITLKEKVLTLQFEEECNYIPLKTTINEFIELTSNITREKVFSKWINESISNNIDYLSLKKKCAVNSTNNLVNFLLENLNYESGISRLLRIYNSEYYYAKTTHLGIKLYKVPSIYQFKKNIEVTSIKALVPNSQANIITIITNKNTKKSIELRNECRFSHGQFNGTPEAKMYYSSGSGLETIYDEV